MALKKTNKTAVVLMNLGGPASLNDVEPFLFNLFFDKAIIDLPIILRWPLAKFIAKKRVAYAQSIYKKIGNASPILRETRQQAEALGRALRGAGNFKVFVAMRHAAPNSIDAAKDVKAYNPDKVILLPLYPQFSTTTTASSFAEWDKSSKKIGLNTQTKKICCYPENKSFVDAHVQLLKCEIDKNRLVEENTRILFSAHGLPQKIINGGDPYESQVHKTVNAVLNKLKKEHNLSPDYRVCYQSKVGPLKWLAPSTSDEIIKAGDEQKSVIVLPIAFVSEHSETLVELDIDFRELAIKHHVPGYFRVPTLSSNKIFIQALRGLCLGDNLQKKCTKGFTKCFFN
ncbi:MAG: ferrochelatase [Sphingomonadales bacterium]